jgi:hypothetical protein
MYATLASRTAFRSSMLLTALLVAAGPLVAGDGKRAPARCTAAPGALLAKTANGWRAVAAGQAAPTETPLVALFDATLRSANDGVEARLLTDIEQRGPLPILETAAIVHADAVHDLSLTLLRGLLVLTNVKKQGPATVRLTSCGNTVDVTLKEPGAKLAMEIYSRHAPGAPQLDDPKQDNPTMHVFCLAVAGESFLQGKERGVTLHAPPGPAVLVWDSRFREPEVERLDELPPEIKTMKEKDQKRLDEACAWARTIDAAKPAAALKAGLGSPSSNVRKAAVTALGALDDVRGLFQVLASSPHADARAHAVLVLRHWLGREPGQTGRLDAGLRKAGLSPVQSQNVLHLLYGFTEDEQREPATYDLLIEDLKSSRPALRELSHWHLVRLAPAGKSIAYDAQAPEAERERGYAQWRKLIPSGKLPPSPTSNGR